MGNGRLFEHCSWFYVNNKIIDDDDDETNYFPEHVIVRGVRECLQNYG